MKILPEISPEDIFYELPEDRIAKYSLKEREKSLLLVSDCNGFSTITFSEAGKHLPADSMLVLNNAKVIHARFIFRRNSGARIEVFLLEPVLPSSYEQVFNSTGECTWNCMIGNAKKWKGDILSGTFSLGNETVTLTAEKTGSDKVLFRWDCSIAFSEVLKAYGHIPLPPYIKREAEERDRSDYQTVFSRIPGSVAAPTAGLHFTEEMMNEMRKQGFAFEELTLHVGAGTFLPVQTENVTEHKMHSEKIIIPRSFIENILKHDKQIVAVGTTSVRTMESLAAIAAQIQKTGFSMTMYFSISQWETYEHKFNGRKEVCKVFLEYMNKHHLESISAETSLMIIPGFRFMFTDILITNFHQPHSTLLLLVSAFMGKKWKDMYRYALDNNYRFLSYGDACLIL